MVDVVENRSNLYCRSPLTEGTFSLKSKPWKIFLWTFIAFNTITSLLDAAIIFPQCTPVELNWDHSIEGHCWSDMAINATGIVQGCVSTLTMDNAVRHAADVSMTAIAAATDIILSTIPVLFLWNVKIKTHIKIGICGVMMLGFS